MIWLKKGQFVSANQSATADINDYAEMWRDDFWLFIVVLLLFIDESAR